MTVRLLRERIRIKVSRIPAHGFKVIRDHSLRYTWNCRRHAGLYRNFARQTPKAEPFPARLGKECRQNVGNKVHQAVADHVRDQIATPQIESGQDCARGKSDQDIGRTS